jgi:hypothetical protein
VQGANQCPANAVKPSDALRFRELISGALLQNCLNSIA